MIKLALCVIQVTIQTFAYIYIFPGLLDRKYINYMYCIFIYTLQKQYATIHIPQEIVVIINYFDNNIT